MQMPGARGPFSAAVLGRLTRLDLVEPGASEETPAARARRAVDVCVDICTDDDLQLGLYLLYEQHYGGLPGVPAELEWSLDLLEARAVVEGVFEADLRRRFADSQPENTSEPTDVVRLLFDMTSRPSGPGGSISGFVARHATCDQVAEALVLKSPYQLKEADPQTWALPRLKGRAKAALVEIQTDEYGGGRFERMHAQLFARCMRGLGLDDSPNAYLDHIPSLWLATVNVISMFGLHRRLRAALCGHLTVVEMTSSLPSKRWVAGLQRLGLGEDATEFFEEHVEADAVHEQIAAHDLCGNLVADEPHLLGDVLFGAAACIGLDALTTDAALAGWQSGTTALRRPLQPRPAEASADRL